MTELLELMGRVARDAGEAILEVYGEEDFGVEAKADDSPLTRADLASHHIILEGLRAGAPDLPILSEESDCVPFEERRAWRRFFLVDPLDGTKEFISRNGEFTVNIALVEDGLPVLGVVCAPVMDLLYTGDLAAGRARLESPEGVRDISARPLDTGSPLTLVASRRHGSDALEACLATLRKHFPSLATTGMGSALKLCLVAEGKADLYPRLAPTSEWDTAAAQAVVEAAGGRVVDMQLNPLRYNTKESLLNPFFYVIGDSAFAWGEVLNEVRLP